MGAFVASIFLIVSSMSNTLTWTPQEQESSALLEFEEVIIIEDEGYEKDKDIDSEDESNNREIEVSEEKIKLPTLEEEMAISNVIMEFMSLNEVKNLTDEEWVALEKELSDISLEQMKTMSIGDFIRILRNIKN